MMDALIIAIEAVIIALLVLALLWTQHGARCERRDLYNRLQAGTLPQYAQYAPLVEHKPGNRRANPGDDEVEPDEESIEFAEVSTPGGIATAAASFERLAQ